MRIALIVPGFSAHEEDWCIPALLTLVRALQTRHEITLFTLRYPHRAATYRVAGATVHALGGATRFGVARLPLLMRGLARVRRVHQQRPFDLTHAFWADEPGFLAVRAGHLLGVPAVVSLGGGELERRLDLRYGHGLSRVNRWLVGHTLQRAARVTVGSEWLRARVAPHVANERLAVQPLGVDRALFRAEGAAMPLAQPALLHVATLVPVKGQARLIAALAALHRQGHAAHLHLVGQGPLEGPLRVQAAECGLTPFVHWHGNVAHHELPAYYRAATVHLLSSHFESQGMVVLEAGACGLPTVGTAVGLLPELGDASRTVPPTDDGNALAAAVAPLLADDLSRAAMGRQMQRLIDQRYSLARSIVGWEAIYADAV